MELIALLAPWFVAAPCLLPTVPWLAGRRPRPRGNALVGAMTRVWVYAAATALAVAPSAAQPAVPERGPAVDPVSFRYRRTVPAGTGLAAITLDPAVVAHSRGPSFADLRLVDGANRQVPYVIERLAAATSLPLSVRRIEPRAVGLNTPTSGQLSVYALDAPVVDLPASSLVLETTARGFTRLVSIGVERESDRGPREPWFQVLAKRTWSHAGDRSAAQALTIPVDAVSGSTLVTVIEEGDSRALPLTAARLEVPRYRLRFHHPGAPLLLLYGNDGMRPPVYDVATRTPQMLVLEAAELPLGPEEDTHGVSPENPEALIGPWMFWGALVTAVIVLAGLLVRLMASRR